ncbi:MAG: 30S ribosomal protein S7 [Bacteroidetes bacterium]|jgi:small subunit ribosomal protein S7|nr:30S ribosomal protein S7 [Bacteroidota bacterium]MBU1422223.1 30S ribosomal protein S7 [Bacteroidota bacterium]MBU2636088.1 30S ribosomal protein S7 [Bacteroidota bacterium]MDI6779223.1 30S ribosomal protein S7 [Bacteroidota bacterium]
MRKKQAEKRIVTLDPKYNDILVSRFINCILKEGKKHLARRIVYNAIESIEKKYKSTGLDVFRKALNNVKPLLEIRARRVGGATYQVPTEVREDRSIALAIRWLIRYASERKDKSMSEKLASELFAASNNEGSSIKKKEDTHKMAEANKAFAHFKW